MGHMSSRFNWVSSVSQVMSQFHVNLDTLQDHLSQIPRDHCLLQMHTLSKYAIMR